MEGDTKGQQKRRSPDGYGVESDLQTGRSDISTLQADFPAIAAAEQAVPQYQPSGAPTAASINSAISIAQSAISGALASTSKLIDEANGYVPIRSEGVPRLGRVDS